MAFALVAPTADAATNGLIAFQTPGSTPVIAAIDPGNSTALRKAVPGLPRDSANAAWSADGTMLAFSSTARGNADIYVINADGTGLRQITQEPVAAIDPTWSPDGRRIAFTRISDAGRDIFVTDIGGGAPQRLTTDPGVDQQADWSPDGTQIAFESDRSGNYDIWLMAPDGSGQRPLTSEPADESDAAWSPDSGRLAFSSGAPGAPQREIYTIERTTGSRTPLTNLNSRSVFPAWSPDGRQIAFSREGDLYVTASSGMSPANVPRFLAGGATDPVWAPLPAPVALPTGTVTVTGPASRGRAVSASSGQTLPTGTEVDATGGSLLVAFRRPAVAASTPISTALVQRAEFTIVERTPETLSLRLKSPDCSSAPVTAARTRRPRKSRVRVKHGHFKVINNHLIAGSYLTAYSVTETCRGSFVKVTAGIVEVRPRVGKRRRVLVRAGRSYFVTGRLR